MDAFTALAILLPLAALFGFLNYRFLKLPMTIAVMLLGLLLSLVIIALGQQSPAVVDGARAMVGSIDFEAMLLEVMLGYLLFAGALHVDLARLAEQRRVILALATIGVCISTFMVGTLTYYLLAWLTPSLNVGFIPCLLFGSLISPTDPVAVLGLLKKAGAPKSLETKITGESLFNDGIGVVVFLAILAIATGEQEFSVGFIGKLFLIEAAGGILFGLAIGGLAFWMLKRVDDHKLEVLITLALVTGGYKLAQVLHTSGPLAMVVAGLLIGNPGRTLAMKAKTVQNLDTFWELIDEILNALLFVLIGLEVLLLTLGENYLLAGAIAVPMVLLCRFTAVGLPVVLLKQFRAFTPRAVRVLTWGGLRGGISVALALAVPKDIPGREVFLLMTYVVVIFSIAVQGLTLPALCRGIPKGETP